MAQSNANKINDTYLHHNPSAIIPPLTTNVNITCRPATIDSSIISLKANLQHPHHSMQIRHKAVTDSGATDNMTALPELFEEIIPLDQKNTVTLGDDKTQLSIHGYGWINFMINAKRIRTVAYYVPDLGTTLLSIKHHSKFVGNYFHSENNTSIFAYPNAVFTPDGTSEMVLNIYPSTTATTPYTFNEEDAELVSTQMKEKYIQTITSVNSVKGTKIMSTPKIPLHVPTYIHMSTSHTPEKLAHIPDKLDDETSVTTTKTSHISTTAANQDHHSDNKKNTSDSNQASAQTPPILPTEKLNSSIPSKIKLSRDFVAQATGYHKSNMLMKYFDQVSTPNVTIDSIAKSEILVDGETATLKSKKKNKTPGNLPKHFSDVWHMDIVYGPCAAIGGIKYALLLIDKKTRKCYIYGLTNMKISIKNALQKFVNDVQVKPKLIRTDFDKRLMGGAARQYLDEQKIRVEAAPPKRQHQNGLVERRWQSILTMARNWLRNELLPSKFWFFAIKRGCEIMNILPTKHEEGKISTPYENVHNTKVDYRQLFPIFKKAYIKTETAQDGGHKNSYTTQTIKVICVGTCPDSDSLLFYHPTTKRVISAADAYKFDPTLPSGPQFNLKYDSDFYLTRKSQMPIHQAPTHELGTTCFVLQNNKYTPATILNIPLDEDNEQYTIQLENGDIELLPAEDIFDHDPTTPLKDDPSSVNPIHHWVKHQSKVTLFLQEHWNKPKHGYLHHDKETDEWYFIKGRKLTGEKLHLNDFYKNAESMIKNKKLFQKWKHTNDIINARLSKSLSNIIAHQLRTRHVSAKELIEQTAPTSLLKHKLLHPHDKNIWDASYREEYEGLAHCDTYKIISDEEYKQLKDVTKGLLPTMALATIKKDSDGNPLRAKYRIVVLGNLDPHPWSKRDCFAPVLSQMEMRLLLAIAVKLNVIPKQGDVSQAFIQSVLPPDETYVCRPPAGCPLTPKNSYWLLLKTLYGLKRSPRHWYETATKTLKEMGFRQCTHAPCLFIGTLAPNQPPVYLGMYVDDFLFFSQSPKMEQKFMDEFSAKLPCTFSTEVNYFLGLKFENKKTKNGQLSITLSQESYIDNLLSHLNLNNAAVNTPHSPYRSGYPIDTIPHKLYDSNQQKKLITKMQYLVGSLNWLAISTRPDIATPVALLAKYTHNPTQGHIDAAIRVVKYIKGTKTKGITFTSEDNTSISSFINFPILKDVVTTLTDANWGPQDQSEPSKVTIQKKLDLFQTRSMSGYLMWLNGPLHWVSKRQTYTARSSAEAEIYATDECAKQIRFLSLILQDLKLKSTFMNGPTKLYNDNHACVLWSEAMTTKGLRHVQIRENGVREMVRNNEISIVHVSGKSNLADIFTKEDKDVQHFCELRDKILSCRLAVHALPSYRDFDNISNSSMVPSRSTGGCQ